MFRSSKNHTVRELVTLMSAHRVTRCVLCPGSRNAPINLTLSEHPDFECRTVTDERSAGFVALGWALQAQAPVAVCVTSGSALLNLHPAVAEAAYARIPLLIISADRPAEWIGQQDGQTLPQPGVFGALCRANVHLPQHEAESWYCNRLLNEALCELTHRGGGPVHVNVPLNEPLFETTELPLAPTRAIQRYELSRMTAQDEQELLEIAATLPRRMFLLGQLHKTIHIPSELTQDHAFAIVGEHLCNYPQADCVRPDTLIGGDADYPHIPSPQLLITMGGCLISKRLKKMLRANPPVEHWHLSEDGELCDTFCALTRCIEGDPAELLDLLAAFAEDGDEAYRHLWCTPPAEFTAPYSGMSLVGELMQQLPPRSVLHLANSSAVRYAQLYPLPKDVYVACNRGVNGIEGSLSTAIGFAQQDDRLQFFICGDLSFFYDMNVLSLSPLPSNLRILLLNNGTGGIFKCIGAPQMDCVQGRNHMSAETWAKACGMEYYAMTPASSRHDAWQAMFSAAPRPVLVEAFTDSDQDAALLNAFYQHH